MGALECMVLAAGCQSAQIAGPKGLPNLGRTMVGWVGRSPNGQGGRWGNEAELLQREVHVTPRLIPTVRGKN